MKNFLERTLGFTMALALVLLAVQLVGCADDADLLIPAAKSTLPFSETPDVLMDNVRLAYGSQDLANYAAMLHPEFTFVRQDGRTYDRDTELRIAARMFSGEDYVKPDRTIAGITRIEIDCWEGLGDWVAAPREDREVLSRVYLVSLRFLRTDGGVLSVRGNTRIEVIRDELDEPGEAARYGWRILRQIDGT